MYPLIERLWQQDKSYFSEVCIYIHVQVWDALFHYYPEKEASVNLGTEHFSFATVSKPGMEMVFQNWEKAPDL
jgi:hypothetical protein